MTVVSSERPVAKRVDDRNGFSEEATFFASGSQNLFGVLHRPSGPPAGGVVICPSTHAEFVAGYSIDVAVARVLAARGIAVQRFHYRGVGHSDGAPEETTFATMREDALVATERLVAETGVSRVAFLGARFGGLVAASAAADHRGCPLALVEPTLEAARFFRDAWRATLIRDVKAGVTDRAPGQGLEDALALGQAVDVLGYPICRSLYESARGRTLVGELDDEGRRVLLVQLGRSTSPRRDVEAGSEALRERGCEVDVELVPEDVTWWFPTAAETEQPKRHGLIALASTWLADELTAVPR